MGTVVTIGLDIAKSVFQVHGVNESGAVVVRRRLPRSKVLSFFASLPRCLVGLEACATAHHWVVNSPISATTCGSCRPAT
jgi:transposase